MKNPRIKNPRTKRRIQPLLMLLFGNQNLMFSPGMLLSLSRMNQLLGILILGNCLIRSLLYPKYNSCLISGRLCLSETLVPASGGAYVTCIILFLVLLNLLL